MDINFTDVVASYWTAKEIQAGTAVSLNLLLALFLGLIVGYERAYRGRAAGMRTYGLVCMASAAIVATSGYSSLWFGGQVAGLGPVDPTRIVQGIVTGIGFLGAGVIMKDGLSISGLTTAASIWASSAIGVLIGLGFHVAAILLTAISTVFMLVGARFEDWLTIKQIVSISLKFKPRFVPDEKIIYDAVSSHGYEAYKSSISIINNNKQIEWHFVTASFGKKKSSSLSDLAKAISNLPEIESFQLSHARN